MNLYKIYVEYFGASNCNEMIHIYAHSIEKAYKGIIDEVGNRNNKYGRNIESMTLKEVVKEREILTAKAN